MGIYLTAYCAVMCCNVLLCLQQLVLAHPMFANADSTWSFNQLLQTPLPVHPAATRSRSVSQKDKDRCTHPTSVQHWHHWEGDVKERLQQADIQVNKSPFPTYGLSVVAM